MAKHAVSLGAICLMLAGGWAVSEWRAARTEADLARLRNSMSKLADELSRTRADLASQPNRVETQTVIRVEKQDPSPLQPPPSVSPSAAPAEPPRQLTAADQHAFVEATFEQQTVDPTWSPQATMKARDLIAPVMGPNTTVRSLECRSSLCKVELAQSNVQEAQRVAQQLMSHRASWSGAVSGTLQSTDPDGRAHYVVFLARDAFPVLD